MNHTIFTNISRQFVQFYPANSMPCKQIQTFAFLDHEDQILDSNLGQNIRDKDSNYFCRAWAQSGHNPSNVVMRYPVCVMNLDTVQPVSAFSKSPELTIRYMLTIADLHKNYQPGKDASKCDRRKIPDIIDQCANFIQQYFTYLRGIIYAKDNTGVYHWAHRGLLELMTANGDISGYEQQIKETTRFQSSLKKSNESITGFPWAAAEAYGVRVFFNVTYDICNQVTFDFSQDYGKVKTSYGNDKLKLI